MLPFLLGEHLVARLDLKHDRAQNRLLVRSAFAEEPTLNTAPHAPWPDRRVISKALAAELTTIATWLNAADVVVEATAGGDLTGDLAIALT